MRSINLSIIHARFLVGVFVKCALYFSRGVHPAAIPLSFASSVVIQVCRTIL